MEKLIGTEKQIIWAEKIRNKAVEEIKENIEELEEDLKDVRTKKSLIEEIKSELELSKKTLEKTLSEKNAVWFINNEDRFFDASMYKFIK